MRIWAAPTSELSTNISSLLKCHAKQRPAPGLRITSCHNNGWGCFSRDNLLETAEVLSFMGL